MNPINDNQTNTARNQQQSIQEKNVQQVHSQDASTQESINHESINQESSTFTPAPADTAMAFVRKLKAELHKAVIGQTDSVDQLLIALLAGGHVLLEGVPGTGKTLLAKSLAASFGGKFGRIQFTPDLMPADVMGHTLFNNQTGKFQIRKGPVFTNLLLADEINRAPAKTQAALLEVMQEGQITIEGTPFVLDKPFMVIATQNPIDQEGTYPLPEAQLDRFLMKIIIDYPTEGDELHIFEHVLGGQVGMGLDTSAVNEILSKVQLQALQNKVSKVTLDKKVVEYALRIIRETRNWGSIAHGAGTRGGLSLLQAARAKAFIEGRQHVVPDDVKQLVLPILRHRIWLSADAEIEGNDADYVLSQMLDTIEAPRQ